MLINRSNVLVFYSNRNTNGKKDATGAFIPEATNFKQVNNIPDELFLGVNLKKVKASKRREIVLDKLNSIEKPLDGIAFFGHGWPQGIQFGFRREHIEELVKAMSFVCKRDCKVVLYACLAAENDIRDNIVKDIGPATKGGFADKLRDAMVREGFVGGHVDAHKTAGHTTRNPYVVRFLTDNILTHEKFDYSGGSWIVEPGSMFWKKWVRYLHESKTLRYTFPFLTEMEIKNSLI